MMAGGTDFVRAEEKQREALLNEVREIMPQTLSEEELAAHFDTLPPRYFQVHPAREIVDDLILAHRFMRLQISEEDSALAPVVNWHNAPDRGYSAVKVCTWDRARLFSKIAGSLSGGGLNILSAQIFTRSDGIVLDTFFVTEARTGNLAGPEQRDKFEDILQKALTGEEVNLRALIVKQKISRPLYEAYTGERISTSVRFDNETSETRTVIEIEMEDRLGLLYAISQALSEMNVDIVAAKILTEKGAAIDTFFTRELDGSKIRAPERLRAIERKIREAIQALDGEK
jgi:[protein-PII] uridylyltransferase